MPRWMKRRRLLTINLARGLLSLYSFWMCMDDDGIERRGQEEEIISC